MNEEAKINLLYLIIVLGGISVATATSTKEKSKIKIKEPKRYKVVMHNDDFTPMDFVVDILMQIFGKGKDEAVTLMMTVHKSQRAVVGTYSYDIAQTKVRTAMFRAKEEGYPFRVTCEEA